MFDFNELNKINIMYSDYHQRRYEFSKEHTDISKDIFGINKLNSSIFNGKQKISSLINSIKENNFTSGVFIKLSNSNNLNHRKNMLINNLGTKQTIDNNFAPK